MQPANPYTSTAPAALRALVPSTCARALRMVVLHASGTPSGQRIGADPRVEIDRWHVTRGWGRGTWRARFNPEFRALGYHYVVDVDGRVLTGRHVDEIGAHVKGHNTHSLGVCIVGGAELQARYTRAQWAALEQLVPLLQLLAPRGVAPLRVVGHRDLFPDRNGDGRIDRADWLKTCPGFDVAGWLARGMHPLPANVSGAA